MACETCAPESMFTTPIKVPGVPVNRKFVPLVRVNGQVQELLPGMKLGNEWVESSGSSGQRTIVGVTAADYIFVAGDENTFVVIMSADPQTAEIPAEATHDFPVGTELQVFQLGIGVVTVTAESGVTLLTPNGDDTSAPGDFRVAIKLGPDVWTVG